MFSLPFFSSSLTAITRGEIQKIDGPYKFAAFLASSACVDSMIATPLAPLLHDFVASADPRRLMQLMCFKFFLLTIITKGRLQRRCVIKWLLGALQYAVSTILPAQIWDPLQLPPAVTRLLHTTPLLT